VDHPAQTAHPAHRGDHRIHRAPRMHDHRQIEFPRELQLGHEVILLQVAVEVFDEEVQAAFADRAGALAFDPLAQFVNVSLRMLGQEHRMQSVSGIQSGGLQADIAQLRPACRGHRRHYLRPHAGSAGALDHLRTVRIELSGIQVAMTVHQHGQRSSSGGALGGDRVFQLASSRVPMPSSSSSTNGIGSGTTSVIANRPAVSLNRVGKRSRRAQLSRGSSMGLAIVEFREVPMQTLSWA